MQQLFKAGFLSYNFMLKDMRRAIIKVLAQIRQKKNTKTLLESEIGFHLQELFGDSRVACITNSQHMVQILLDIYQLSSPQFSPARHLSSKCRASRCKHGVGTTAMQLITFALNKKILFVLLTSYITPSPGQLQSLHILSPSMRISGGSI